MHDYAKLYRREHRRRVVAECRLKRIRKTLISGLSRGAMLVIIALLTRKINV